MSHAVSATPPPMSDPAVGARSTGASEAGHRRHRHRSPRRKVAESLVLILGVPALLFVVVALSVELIEYRPASNAISTDPRSAVPTAAGGMRTSGRLPVSPVVEIPPFEPGKRLGID